jgi:hypothetical protein
LGGLCAAFFIPKLMTGLIVELLRHTFAGKDLLALQGFSPASKVSPLSAVQVLRALNN